MEMGFKIWVALFLAVASFFIAAESAYANQARVSNRKAVVSRSKSKVGQRSPHWSKKISKEHKKFLNLLDDSVNELDASDEKLKGSGEFSEDTTDMSYSKSLFIRKRKKQEENTHENNIDTTTSAIVAQIKPTSTTEDHTASYDSSPPSEVSQGKSLVHRPPHRHQLLPPPHPHAFRLSIPIPHPLISNRRKLLPRPPPTPDPNNPPPIYRHHTELKQLKGGKSLKKAGPLHYFNNRLEERNKEKYSAKYPRFGPFSNYDRVLRKKTVKPKRKYYKKSYSHFLPHRAGPPPLRALKPFGPRPLLHAGPGVVPRPLIGGPPVKKVVHSTFVWH